VPRGRRRKAASSGLGPNSLRKEGVGIGLPGVRKGGRLNTRGIKTQGSPRRRAMEVLEKNKKDLRGRPKELLEHVSLDIGGGEGSSFTSWRFGGGERRRRMTKRRGDPPKCWKVVGSFLGLGTIQGEVSPQKRYPFPRPIPAVSKGIFLSESLKEDERLPLPRHHGRTRREDLSRFAVPMPKEAASFLSTGE